MIQHISTQAAGYR